MNDQIISEMDDVLPVTRTKFVTDYFIQGLHLARIDLAFIQPARGLY
jgi:hypothetical protein